MTSEAKDSVKNSIGRLILVVVVLFIQVRWILGLLLSLSHASTGLNLLLNLAALFAALLLYGQQENSAFKLSWMALILAFPILGLVLYLLFGHRNVTKRMRRRFESLDQRLLPALSQDKGVMERLEAREFSLANQCHYIHAYSGYPVYQNTDVVFFPHAEEGFEAQLAALAGAERFIFLEYHAIEEAGSFSRLREILAQKAAQGVEVRILYDDVGSVGFIDPGFVRRMEALGIRCRVFNQLRPVLSLFLNNRDHRKLTVIDGRVGFTGGYNLADEYFNITQPYGHWKDTGIQLTGEAVASLTVMFLEMWNAIRETDQDVSPYLSPSGYHAREEGFIQLYADSPLDDEPMGENVYLNLIKGAMHSLYVATPYLIISDEMARELTLAAQRGVDVRILTPGIPDKKLIYRVTRSYYAGLAARGVRIYEYTPGFLHEKQVLCDGEAATVGTVNFDYRSLYHHFENGALLYGYQAVSAIREDFEDTIARSREVTERYRAQDGIALHLVQCVLRLFAPLL